MQWIPNNSLDIYSKTFFPETLPLLRLDVTVPFPQRYRPLPLPDRYQTVPSPFWAENKKLNVHYRYRSLHKIKSKDQKCHKILRSGTVHGNGNVHLIFFSAQNVAVTVRERWCNGLKR